MNKIKWSKENVYKRSLFVIEILIIAATLIAGLVFHLFIEFHLDFDVMFGILIYLQYALYLIEIVSVIYGFIKKRIIARKYIIHILFFIIQLGISALVWGFVINEISSGLAPF